MHETIQLSANQRLLITEDEGAEDPRKWGAHVTGDSPELLAWLNGEVYNVDLQEQTTWQNVADHTDTATTWETIDSLGGCYLGDTYTALDVAEEYFGIVPTLTQTEGKAA